MPRLHKNMTVEEFESGYFYANDLKAFARKLGIAPARLRKFEIEEQIKAYLATGILPEKNSKSRGTSTEPEDTLSAYSSVRNYNGNRKTKAFLLELVQRKDPGSKDKSGQWYWLNDWRRQQAEAGHSFTYGDLAEQLLKLRKTKGRLPQIPSARMNNFISDFLADPDNDGKSKADAQTAWQFVKITLGPKTYSAYKVRISGSDSA